MDANSRWKLDTECRGEA
uniref:Uncharacterized protein n=1 Tax=Arundo donax TaxID=35708 RepID=A0A0A8Z856_ARUDO